MKKLNNKGFSLVEILILILVIVVVAGAGFYLLSKKESDKKATETPTTQTVVNEEPKKDETETWEKVDSIGGAFSVKIPNGWGVTNYPGNRINGDNLTYVAGSEPVINTETQTYSGHQKKLNIVVYDEVYDAPQWKSPNEFGTETNGDYSIGSLKGKKYSIIWDQSVTGVNKGDRIYQYVFNLPNSKQLDIVYMPAAGDADNLKLIEQVIQTIIVK